MGRPHPKPSRHKIYIEPAKGGSFIYAQSRRGIIDTDRLNAVKSVGIKAQTQVKKE